MTIANGRYFDVQNQRLIDVVLDVFDKENDALAYLWESGILDQEQAGSLLGEAARTLIGIIRALSDDMALHGYEIQELTWGLLDRSGQFGQKTS